MSQNTIRGFRHSRVDETPIPMVLAHASGLDASTLFMLTKALAPRTCICPEYVGYPHGQPLPEVPVLEADAETIETAIEKIGRPVHLFGHSYGGRVALEVAQRGKVELETLILFEPVIQGALSHQPPEEFLDVSDSYEPFLSALTNYWGGDRAWDSLSASFRQQQLRRAARIHLEVMQLSHDRVTPEEWASLTIPLLILRGDYGHLDAEQMTQALADAVPMSTLRVIPDAVHMAPIVDARTVGMVIMNWLGLR